MLHKTQLCVGTVSKNVIDAAIEISRDWNIPITLVASRRQVDVGIVGVPYVIKTKDLASYVEQQQPHNVVLGRDHGGQYQGTDEFPMFYPKEEIATARAMTSLTHDIKNGFRYIHLDPSILHPDQGYEIDFVLERLFDLYEGCYETAWKNNKHIEIEVGVEEQNGGIQDIAQLDYFLTEINRFARKHGFPKPKYVVAQTGTKVQEMQNTGHMDIANLMQVLAICKQHDVMLKEHNADYLNSEQLALRPRLGIHASNVAPHFGVAETKTFLHLLNTHDQKEDAIKFAELALESRKWHKWMLPDSQASNLDKVLISGHYIYEHPAVVGMKNRLAEKLDVNSALKRSIKSIMAHYIYPFTTGCK